MSLYIHIPFCRALCHYCGCFTRVVRDDSPIHDYLLLLEKEIELAALITGKQVRAGYIHFGGGSPNLLSGDDIARILGFLNGKFPFESGVEIALEADPRQMDAGKARGYASAGVNRVSLGVQDLNEKTQRAINRVQPFAQVAACTEWLRGVGIKSINFDLIYGLPYQTADTLAGNASKAAALGPDRIALFGYAHVPWMKPHQRNLEKHLLPDAEDRYEQEKSARAVLIRKGYMPIGMDHFALSGDMLAIAAREGTLRRNFQGYTADNSSGVIGFGLSAISRSSDGYTQNTASFKTYHERLEEGQLPWEKGRVLSPEDRLRADIIERMMCYFTVDAGEICKMNGFPPAYVDDSLKKIRAMEKDGIVEVDGRIVTVTEQGRYFVRSICSCFDSYFTYSAKTYANAV